MKVSFALTLIAGTVTALTTGALAQPKFIVTGAAQNLTANGNGVCGLAYNGASETVIAFTWTRGAGATLIPGVDFPGYGSFAASDDLTIFSAALDNTSDWQGLNCFNGYDSTGAPRPPQVPCPVRAITHRYSPGTGWTNLGSFPRSIDPVTGRFIGGTSCDGEINAPSGISGDGRFISGNGWSARAVTSSGGVALGLCGDFLPFRYDALTSTLEMLPVQPGTTTSRVDRISGDGSTLTGHDLGPSPSGDTTRRTCVWKDGVQSILDPYLGAKDNAAVNRPGNIVATGPSYARTAELFPGQIGARLVKWTFSAGTWTPANLGKPADFLDPNSGVPIACTNIFGVAISDDGNTIIGTAQYGAPPPDVSGFRRPFIWRPSINSGVPIDLENYVNSLTSPAQRIFVNGFTIDTARTLSASGNAIGIDVFDQRNTCTQPQVSLMTFNSGILYLDGSSIPCEPPRITLQPSNYTQTQNLPFGAPVNVYATGSHPLALQWQREDPNAPGTWINLADSCSGTATTGFPLDNSWNYEGTRTRQLRVNSFEGGSGRAGRYRVVVSNACGSVTSEAAQVGFQYGACCLPGTACTQMFFVDCTNAQAGGLFLGAGSACVPEPCESWPCCRGATCSIRIASQCTAPPGAAGVFVAVGSFSECNSGGFLSPCCYADYNKIGGSTVQDIFDFLTDWFSGSGFADVGGDGAGTPTVQDIFDFLSAWFQGC